MKKKVQVLLFLLMSLFLVSGCSKNEEEVITDATKFKEEYESLNGTINESSGKEIRSITIDEDNPIVYKEASDIVDAINNKETFLVYFGFATCPWCRSVVQTMLSTAKELGIKEIYYVDVLDIRDTLTLDDNNKVVESKKGSDAYYELLDLLNPVLSDYILYGYNDKNVNTKEKRIYAPNVIAVIDGTPEKLESGISDLETDPYMELTDEINEDMKNKFTCLMECLNKNNTCTKNAC
jgi:predicted bacteriocin transport accessory protein